MLSTAAALTAALAGLRQVHAAQARCSRRRYAVGEGLPTTTASTVGKGRTHNTPQKIWHAIPQDIDQRHKNRQRKQLAH